MKKQTIFLFTIIMKKITKFVDNPRITEYHGIDSVI
jgi:hypothetical protein